MNADLRMHTTTNKYGGSMHGSISQGADISEAVDIEEWLVIWSQVKLGGQLIKTYLKLIKVQATSILNWGYFPGERRRDILSNWRIDNSNWTSR